MSSSQAYLIGFLILLFMGTSSLTAADQVDIRLKDRTRLKGTIISEDDKQIIMLADKKRVVINRKKIKTIKRKTIEYPDMPESPWEVLGPGGGGAMYVPTLSPLDPDLGLIACDMSGVYLTRDGGKQWTLLPASLIGRYGHGMKFSYHDPRVIFIGTSSRLFRSQDGGVSWTGVTEDRKYPKNSVMDVLLDPDNPNIVWACFGKGEESGIKVHAGNNMIIERSNNGGKSFFNASKGLPTGSGLVRQLAIDVNSDKRRRQLYAATTQGLFSSNDGAATWKKIGSGLPHANIRQVVTMSDREQEKTTVLVSMEPSGVYRSEDGQQFHKVQGIPDQAIIESLAASTEHPDIAWAAGTDIWKTTDGGKTWQTVFGKAEKKAGWLSTFYSWPQRKARGIGCDPFDPERVWITGDMQLWSTRDGGKTFTERNSYPIPENSKRQSFVDAKSLGRFGLAAKPGPKFFRGGGLEVTFVYQVLCDPHESDRIYSFYADIGGFRSEDYGYSWTYNLGIWNQGLKSSWRNSCYDLAFHPKKEGMIWGAFTGLHNLPAALNGSKYEVGGVAFSKDAGKSWLPFENAGLPEKPVTALCYDKTMKGPTLYAAVYGSGVYMTRNGGQQWQPLNKGLPNNPYVWRIRQSADGSVYLICVKGKPGGVWRLNKKEQRWQRLDQNMKFSDVRDIIVDKGDDWDPKFLAIAVYGEKGGVFVTEDSGQTWTKLFNQSVSSVDCTPDRAIWYAAGRGLWRSNKGKTWHKLEFPFSTLNDVTIDPNRPETLWIGTMGGGVFKGKTGAKESKKKKR